MAFQHLRSSTASKRPTPAAMGDGQLAINTNTASPGLFFKDSAGELIKVGPVHVGSTAPNGSPASGGETGNTVGEQWLDTSGTNPVFKIWDGSAWQSEAGEFVNASGDTMTGALGIIAGTESAPGLFVSGDDNTGIYSPGADQVAISTNGTGRLFVDASGRVGVGTGSPSSPLHIANTSPAIRLEDTDGTSQYSSISHLGSNLFVDVRNDAAGGATIFRTYPSTERLRITSDGKLGLGTSSPGTELEVVSTAPEIKARATGNSTGKLSTDNNRAASVIGGQIIGKWNGNDVARIDFLNGADGTNKDDGEISFATSNNGSNPQSRLYITQAGNVGVGTTSPLGQTHIQSSSTGLSAVNAAGDELVIEGGGNSGMTILAGNTSQSSIYFADSDNAQPGALNYSHNDNSLAFRVNANERARIDSSGRLLVGTSTALAAGNSTPYVQVVGEGAAAWQSLIRTGATIAGSNLVLGQTRGSVGSRTIAQEDDILSTINFAGDDGTDLNSVAAWIRGEVDGTPGTDDMPGRLVFSTTADGASSPTERMRITQAGFTKLSNAGTYYDSTGGYHEARTTTNDASIILTATNATYTKEALRIFVTKAANSDWYFADWWSGVTTDKEFGFRGDGQAYADGSWNGGGADYAEYFEWSDSNPNGEDRRGISVVLHGDKIREAQAGEDPIGVISGNPSVVGDAAWNKWSGKYLRDEFGAYIQEDYEVTDEDGNTVIQQRRKLNPAYDPDAEYISREERPEWDCVGLMGKLRIRKGQVTGSRWIKMRDISDSVEEWLVR